MPKQFYVLSLKHSRGDYLLWWGPKSSGYSRHLDQAGLYSEDEVTTHKSTFNNGESTLAIPEETVLKHVRRVVYVDDVSAICGQRIIPTNDGLQTQEFFDREGARLRKEQEERKKRIDAGDEDWHYEWCPGGRYEEED